MKNLLFLLLMTVATTVSAQNNYGIEKFMNVAAFDSVQEESINPENFIDNNGIMYASTLKGITAYHESDWLLSDTGVNFTTGRRTLVYYNDSAVPATVYVYELLDNKCKEWYVSHDSKDLQNAQHALKILLSIEEDDVSSR